MSILFHHKMQIGEYVRILDTTGRYAHVGLVSYIHSDKPNTEFDIIFDQNGTDNEETNVEASRVHKLQHFEVGFHPRIHPSEDPHQIKDFGNTLFALKDFETASKYYKYALKLLSKTNTLSIGSNVLVISKESFTDIRIGMICSILTGDEKAHPRFEIVYDNDHDEGDDDEGVPVERLTALCRPQKSSSSSDTSSGIINRSALEEWQLQRSLYLNLSKCCMKTSTPGWAVKWSSMALATTRFIIDNQDQDEAYITQLHKQLVDAYFIRASAYLAAGRPNLASRDGAAMAQYDVARARGVQTEVEAFLTRRRQLNRRLARDVAQWVDTAMSLAQSHSQAKPSSTGGNADDTYIDGDLPIESDEPVPVPNQKSTQNSQTKVAFEDSISNSNPSKGVSSAVLLNLSLCMLLLAAILSAYV